MIEVKFEIPAYLGFVPIIRTAIERMAHLFSFNGKDAYELKMAFDEICNNAIEHGSKGEDKKINIECQFNNKVATITIKDSGSPEFNVEEAQITSEMRAAGIVANIFMFNGEKLDINTVKMFPADFLADVLMEINIER